MQQQTFPAKTPSEQLKFGFDFSNQLAAGETLASGSVACTVFSGTDASPSAMISGAASVSGGSLVQLVIGGLAGNVYRLTASATTSTGQTLQVSGVLAITQGIV